MPTSVEVLLALEKHRLLPSADVAVVRERWFRPGRKNAVDSAKFFDWLVLNHYLTAYAADVVSRGKVEQLVLKQYQIRDRIKDGPMAGSLLASDPLQRTVAIEILVPQHAYDPAGFAVIQQTAQRLIQLRHPNIGRVLDLDACHGLHYLVQEYYQGETLAAVIARRGKLPVLQATRIFSLTLAALQALHDAGIPGGDLGADCILLTKSKAKGERTVKLVHAGLRRQFFDNNVLTPGQASAESEMTLTAMPVQQQALSRDEPADDIFRLGCVFFHVLTGSPPYSPEELANPNRAIASVRWLAPETPDMLADLVEQMLDPSPAAKKRNTAGNVAKALRVFLAAEEEAEDIKPEDTVTVPVVTEATRSRPATAPEPATRDGEEPVDNRAEEPAADQEPDEELAAVEPERPAPAPKRKQKKRIAAESGAATSSLAEMWRDYTDLDERDLLFGAAGAVGLLVLLLLLRLFTGWQLVNVVCLLAGASISYLVDRLVRWRLAQAERRPS
jgi:eukaryotic-like serine/threonine-protein kinase